MFVLLIYKNCHLFQLVVEYFTGSEKKRSKQKLEVQYCEKDPEVLIVPYVMTESKLKDGVVALWPPVKFREIYSYLLQRHARTVYKRKSEIPTRALRL